MPHGKEPCRTSYFFCPFIRLALSNSAPLGFGYSALPAAGIVAGLCPPWCFKHGASNYTKTSRGGARFLEASGQRLVVSGERLASRSPRRSTSRPPRDPAITPPVFQRRGAEGRRSGGMWGATAPILGNRRGDALRASCAAMHRRAETAFRPPPHDCARPPAFPPDRESCSAAWEN